MNLLNVRGLVRGCNFGRLFGADARAIRAGDYSKPMLSEGGGWEGQWVVRIIYFNRVHSRIFSQILSTERRRNVHQTRTVPCLLSSSSSSSLLERAGRGVAQEKNI